MELQFATNTCANNNHTCANDNDSFDLLTPVKAMSIDNMFIDVAQIDRQRWSKREERCRRNDPEKWDENYSSLAVHSTEAFQRKIDFPFFKHSLHWKIYMSQALAHKTEELQLSLLVIKSIFEGQSKTCFLPFF